jgi:ABC-type antimicrobial peptide transport system permease subunit
MNGLSLTAVGVLPPLPQYPGQDDVYITVPACPFRSNPQAATARSAHLLTLFGRLQPGASLAQARAEVATTAKRLRQEFPQYYPGVRSSNVTVVPVQELLVSEIRPTLFILLATVGLVLLITCANLANLSLARLMRREQEVTLRVALGAGRGRLLRQLLTESVLLALIGGALGLALATAGSDLLVAFARLFTPRVQDITIDARVLVFTLLVSILTGIGFGMMPALQMIRLAFVLLTGAGLMVRSLRALQEVNGGYDPSNVLTVRIDLPFTKYSMETSMPFFRRLLEEIRRNPSVRSAAVASSFPLYRQPSTPLLKIEDRPLEPGEEPAEADFLIVSPEYFKTLGIPLLQGRLFSDTDADPRPPVAVISRSLAHRYWPHQSPIGHRISSSTFDGEVWLTVIGVVDDVRHTRVDAQPSDTFYVSYLQAEEIDMSVLVRTVGDPAVVANEIRRAVHALDPEQPVAEVQTLAELRDRSIAPSRLTADLLVIFALLAFTITAIGLSAVVAFVVGQRTQEIGLRMALGANRISLLGMVMRQGMLLVLLGLVLGWAGALAGNRLLSSLLFGIQPSDPFTFWSITLALLVCGSAACFIPARRAAFIDPKEALRS